MEVTWTVSWRRERLIVVYEAFGMRGSVWRNFFEMRGSQGITAGL